MPSRAPYEAYTSASERQGGTVQGSDNILPEDSASNKGIPTVAPDFLFESSTHSSAVSVISAASADGQHCYVFGTLLKDSNGKWVPVDQMQEQGTICGESGSPIRISKLVKYEEEPQDLVCLQTGDASLTVTASHRIMIMRGGHKVPAPAKSLQIGDDIVCKQGNQKLTKIERTKESVPVVEITFCPDEDVEAFQRPPDVILTRGFRKAQTRRGGMKRHGSGGGVAEDCSSIPATLDSWM